MKLTFQFFFTMVFLSGFVGILKTSDASSSKRQAPLSPLQLLAATLATTDNQSPNFEQSQLRPQHSFLGFGQRRVDWRDLSGAVIKTEHFPRQGNMPA